MSTNLKDDLLYKQVIIGLNQLIMVRNNGEEIMKSKEKKYRFIPGVILDDADEEIIYSLTNGCNTCARCPLKGLCG
ncbi:hypothetical protein [Desulfurococcus sp.]|uniref:hypothetical protein n=1 Tax=Desulfurococcus sp. TaxID=51678 RepID=UPI00319E55AB